MGQTGKTEWFSNTFPIDSIGGTTWASKFHIWRMDWDENAISLFVDDVLLNKVELRKLVNKDGSDLILLSNHIICCSILQWEESMVAI